MAPEAAFSLAGGAGCSRRLAWPVRRPPPLDWSTVQASFESLEEARFIVLGSGAGAHVPAPAELPTRVREEAQKAAARPVVEMVPS